MREPRAVTLAHPLSEITVYRLNEQPADQLDCHSYGKARQAHVDELPHLPLGPGGVRVVHCGTRAALRGGSWPQAPTRATPVSSTTEFPSSAAAPAAGSSAAAVQSRRVDGPLPGRLPSALQAAERG